MSSSQQTPAWFDRYWQVLIILFGVAWVLIWAFYNPTV